MSPMHFSGMVIDHAGAEGQLNVGMIGIALGRNKALCFRHIGSDSPFALCAPLPDGLDHVPSAFEGAAHGVIDNGCFVYQHRGDVVL